MDRNQWARWTEIPITVAGFLLLVVNRVHSQLPENWLAYGVLSMDLWRKRVILCNADFMLACSATIDTCVGCCRPRFMKLVERVTIAGRNEIFLLIQSHIVSFQVSYTTSKMLLLQQLLILPSVCSARSLTKPMNNSTQKSIMITIFIRISHL
jgi:hypothetical protein